MIRPTAPTAIPRAQPRPAAGAGAPQRGLTLIELMIVVVVVSILASVALPSYSQYVRKSHRAEAQQWLMAVATRQQQFLVDTRGFAALDAVGIPVPAAVAANYTLAMTVEAGPPPTFSATATPKDAQAVEGCGTLGIDQVGTKTAAKAGCW